MFVGTLVALKMETLLAISSFAHVQFRTEGGGNCDTVDSGILLLQLTNASDSAAKLLLEKMTRPTHSRDLSPISCNDVLKASCAFLKAV